MMRLNTWLTCAFFYVSFVPAFATIITYTDRTAWQTATTNDTNIDFEGQTPVDTAKAYSDSNGYKQSGVQFEGINGFGFALSIVNPGPNTSYYNWGSGASLQSGFYFGGANVPYIHVILPTSITAFGVDLMTGNPNAQSVKVAVNGTGNLTDATAAKPTRTFFGVTSDSAIGTIDFSIVNPQANSGAYVLLDNFSFGTVKPAAPPPPLTEVPEVATMFLIGTGLAAMAILRKRAL